VHFFNRRNITVARSRGGAIRCRLNKNHQVCKTPKWKKFDEVRQGMSPIYQHLSPYGDPSERLPIKELSFYLRSVTQKRVRQRDTVENSSDGRGNSVYFLI